VARSRFTAPIFITAAAAIWTVGAPGVRAGDDDDRIIDRGELVTNVGQRGGPCDCNADVNNDGGLPNFSDVSAVFDCTQGDCSGCINSCDINCDGAVDACDVGVAVSAFIGLPDPCADVCSACCEGGGPNCIETTADACSLIYAGAYLGDGVLCEPGICGGLPCTDDLDCDDGDPCTDDVCLPEGMCINDPIPGCVPIPPGQDCWNTQCGDTQYSFQKNPTPLNLFGPGSLPFDGIVHFQGAGDETGDTKIARLEPAAPPLGGQDTIPIQITQLSLTSCAPITVQFEGGGTSLWDVEVELSPTPAPTGQMTITKTHDNGGTFESELYVRPLFRFFEQGGSGFAELDTALVGKPPFRLDTTNVSHWVHNPGGLLVNKCNGGLFNSFAPGVKQNTLTLNMCCTPTGHAGPGHLHVTGQTCTPCPDGACCNTASGTCTLVADAATCKGEYMGDGTDCRDEDGDGIADWFETNNCNDPDRNECYTGTDPNNPDTDGDGWTDGFELKKTKCDPCVPDEDLDGDGFPDTCLHYLKWSQPPVTVGEDIPSNIDWVDGDPNIDVADDFVSDGRPITAVRWWGSNIPKTPDDIKPGTDVGQGVDLWYTPPGSTSQNFQGTPIPVGFFDPGSDPFTDIVDFQGVPLPSSPSLGATDTIVQRLADAPMPDCPSDLVTVPIEIVALSLTSTQPITVTYNGGQNPELWDVDVHLSSTTPQQQGTMDIEQRCGAGGIYTAQLPVLWEATFTRIGDGQVRVFDIGLQSFGPTNFDVSGEWVYQPDPIFQPTFALPGTQVDTDGDFLFDTILGIGTSNFFPGFQAKNCFSCKVPDDGQNKPPLTPEQAMWAAHGVNPPNQDDQQFCCIPGEACFPADPTECADSGGFEVPDCIECTISGKRTANDIRVIGAVQPERDHGMAAADIELGAENIFQTKPPLPSVETKHLRGGTGQEFDSPPTVFAQATWAEMAAAAGQTGEPGQIDKAPPLINSFAGTIDNNTSIPPDTHGAVGRNHIVEILNTGFTIYDRGGGVVAPQISLQAFWAPLGVAPGMPANDPFDPKVLYDQYVDRFVVTTVSNRGAPNSYVLVGISQTNSPTGLWNLYAIQADVGPDVGLWADYPGFGLDPNNVIISNNMFTVAANPVFQHVDVWVIDKASLIAGAGPLVLGADYALFHDPCGTGAFTMQPCHTFGQTPASAINHLVDEGWIDLATRTRRFIRVKDITGVGAGAVLNCRGNDYVEVNGYNFCQADAPQPLCSVDIETNDTRLLNAVCFKDNIYTTHSVGIGAPADGLCDTVVARTRTEVSWYEIPPAAAGAFPGGAPNQQGRVSDPSLAYYFPSIAVNKDFCVALGFSGSDDATFASGYYTVHDPAVNAPGATEPVSLLKAGVDSYWKIFGGTRNRWGDYSATVLDPIDLHTFWTVQEYAEAQFGGGVPPAFCANQQGRWGTWWGSFQCENAIDGWFVSFHEPIAKATVTASTGVMGGGTKDALSDRNARYVRPIRTGATGAWVIADPTPAEPGRIDKTVLPADYQWDDGDAETSVGVNDGTNGNAFGWANRFTNLTGGDIILESLEVAFGEPGGAMGVAVGDAVQGVVWVDAAATGNMVNATKVAEWSIPGGVHANDGVTFATHTIPDKVVVPAGADFYVGLGDIQSLDGVMRFPAAEDQDSTAGMSWAFFDPNNNIWDPDNLALQTVGLIDDFGLPGNWLVRANAKPAVGEALALYYCDVKVVDAVKDDVPDCLGHQVYDYFVNLDQCCLVHSNPDSRSGWLPGMKEAFYEEKCFDYALDIQAVVGHQYYQDKETGECIESPTGKSATGDFWGWHTGGFPCSTADEDLGKLPPLSAVQTVVAMGPLGEWLYGPWDPVVPQCSVPDMAFELYTDTPVGGVDDNGNCVPDQCEQTCVVASQPTNKPTPVPIDIGFGTKNRYLSFVAGDAGRNQAVHVEFVNVPGFSYANGRKAWVQQPFMVTESSGADGPLPAPTLWVAQLGCTPFFTDWSTYGTVNVIDAGIIPDGAYDVRVLDDSCMCTYAEMSPPLRVDMSAFGDVVGTACAPPPCNAPQGVIDFVDVSAVVEKFKNSPEALRKARADITNSTVALPLPDRKVDFVDISCVVQAFIGSPCPVAGPPTSDPCPNKCP
jgi:hypothetical protein